jgi:hypothetical protein
MVLAQLLRQLRATAFVSSLHSTVHTATAPPGLHTVSKPVLKFLCMSLWTELVN